MDGTNYSNGFHTIPEEDQNGYHHERMDRFVKEWIMKSPKRFFTFAVIPYLSCCYVGILAKDRIFYRQSLKNLTWLFKQLWLAVKMDIYEKNIRP